MYAWRRGETLKNARARMQKANASNARGSQCTRGVREQCTRGVREQCTRGVREQCTRGATCLGILGTCLGILAELGG